MWRFKKLTRPHGRMLDNTKEHFTAPLRGEKALLGLGKDAERELERVETLGPLPSSIFGLMFPKDTRTTKRGL